MVSAAVMLQHMSLSQIKFHVCCRSRYETEKRHGAGRGNWGTEEDAVKE